MKHADIIGKLTLEEKCKLLQGKTTFGSWPLPERGIPAIEFSDGPNGVRHQAGAADHLGLNGSEPATCFPTAVTVANTWDEELGERIGAAMGEEAVAQGVNVLLGPGLCIKRNPLCGRNFEYFSEDPHLSGKLAETWPLRWEDVPSSAGYPSDQKQAQYREGIYVGYRYFDTAGREVAFPFGYGLSYTTFAYSDLQATASGVSFTVANTGKVAGAEVAQLYVAKPDHQVFRAEQELKGFARVELAPGESREVTIPLDDKAFRYFNTRTNAWEVEPGAYELRVGASSRDIRLAATIEVAGTGAPDPYEGRDVSAYESADVLCVSDASFEALLGHAVPGEGPAISRNMCFRDLNHGRSPLFWIVWAVLKAMKSHSEKSGKPNLNVLFIWNMPLRALAKMTNGMVNMRMVDALVMEIRGFWIIGILRFIVEFVVNLVQNATSE